MSDPLVTAEAELRRGQEIAALATPEAFVAALRAYALASEVLTSAPDGLPRRRLLAVIAMNRGNVLQKLGAEAHRDAILAAYDEAIALLSALPLDHDPALRNHLGAAWLNRGHALRHSSLAQDIAECLRSHREAIALLARLPLDVSPAYRANLAGAWLNLADTLVFSDEPTRHTAAYDAALRALALTAAEETGERAFAELGLMARRAALIALGYLLAEAAPATRDSLLGETSDLVDTGLALARQWDGAGIPVIRPLAGRLLYYGAEFYRRHQPQFLAEFLLENLDPAAGAPSAWATSEPLREIARDALARAQEDLQQPRLLIAGDAYTERTLALRASFNEAATRLA